MGLIVKIALICTILGGTLLGNLGLSNKLFGSDSVVGNMAVGVVGIIVALVALTFLLKFLWRFIGCFSTIIIALVLIVILLMVTGTFDAVLGSAKGLIDGTASASARTDNSVGITSSSPEAPVNYIPVVNADGTTSFVPISNPSAPASPMQQARNTNEFRGSVSAIRNGGRFVVGDLEVILYGIDAPDAKQMCSDKRGRPYNCGQESIRQLRRFTGSTELTCKVKERGNNPALVSAVCNIDNNDIGVAMVSSGWAFALPNVTSVYVPYEQVAKSNGSGMWGGQFYKPAEWRAREAAAQREANKSSSFFGNLFK